jgi:hypothetical protein
MSLPRTPSFNNNNYIYKKYCPVKLDHLSLSLENYIKPQLSDQERNCCICCLSLENYIKPQPF